MIFCTYQQSFPQVLWIDKNQLYIPTCYPFNRYFLMHSGARPAKKKDLSVYFLYKEISKSVILNFTKELAAGRAVLLLAGEC